MALNVNRNVHDAFYRSVYTNYLTNVRSTVFASPEQLKQTRLSLPLGAFFNVP